VEPLARYFEYWLLRLQGVYPSIATCPGCRGALDAPGGGAYLVPGSAVFTCTACAPAAHVREPHLSRGALAFPSRGAAHAAAGAGQGRRDRRRPGGARGGAPPAHGATPRARVEIHAGPARPAASGARGAAAGSGIEALTFQDLIFKLSQFWVAQGCVLQQPLDLEVGAGTSHPETLLRVLGPQHWNVAYVQPSRRPDDGRFGENPNRLFKHHQLQVILKPSPDEVQAVYLQSLEACGINPRQHDIRFEEDNWESPTLGAWGIGWQVLFDGLEITQFTYFQQVGGIDLSPIACEITYGLERIGWRCSGRQRVRHAVGAGRELWGGPAARGDRAVQVRLRAGGHPPRGVRGAPSRPLRAPLRVLRRAPAIRPGASALEECLKCSHLFNILDASGSVGVSERTAYILRVRQLAVAIAKVYVEGLAPR